MTRNVLLYKVDSSAHWLDESFEIRLRNHKKEPAEIRVVEHLYRWKNWQITHQPLDFRKLESQTIEFRAVVRPESEQVLNYTVHYTW